MNVTLKLPDELVREARHRAVHRSQSLSSWVAELVRRELTDGEQPKAAQASLLEALSPPGMPEWFYEKDLPLPDRLEQRSAFTFEPDED